MDKELIFLSNCDNELLKLLVDTMIYDNDGKTRWTEELTSNEEFMKNYPDNLQTEVPTIIEELQKFGGNTIKNKIRRHGVSYREILENVCDKLKVNYNKCCQTELLEQYLLQKISLLSIDKMTEEDLRYLSTKHSKEALKHQLSLMKVGSPLYIRLLTMIVANITKKYGLQQATKYVGIFAGSRVFAALTGPIGWAFSGAWTIYDLAGTAYRVIIPCTIIIAYLRIINNKTEKELNEILK